MYRICFFRLRVLLPRVYFIESGLFSCVIHMNRRNSCFFFFYSSDVVVMPSHNCHAKWGKKPNPCVKREEVEKRANPEQ
jgi:hypothetical protein